MPWLEGVWRRTVLVFSLPAVTLAVGLVLSTQVYSQDLDAGKNAAQLFSANCSACHRSPQGLAKGRGAMALAGFLRQHYTTGQQPASELASYLASVGGEPRAPAKRTPTGLATQTPDTQPKPPAATGREGAARAAPTPSPPPRRPRRAGELASVSSDPDPVTISAQPLPVVHHRAASQVQEMRPPPPPPPAAGTMQTVDAKQSAVGTARPSPTGEDRPSGANSPPEQQPPQPFSGPLP